MVVNSGISGKLRSGHDGTHKPIRHGRSAQRRGPRPGRCPRWRPHAEQAIPAGGYARCGQDHDRLAVPDGGRAQGRIGPLCHLVGNRSGAAGCRLLPWMGPGQHPHARDAAHAGDPASGRAVHDVPSVGSGTERYDAAHPQGRRRTQADPHRLRFPVRTAFVVGQFAALSPPDTRPQAILRGSPVHGSAAGRHDSHRTRPPGPEHRARRAAAGAAQFGLRPGAPAAGDREVPRPVVPRRLPRPTRSCAAA